MSTIQDLSGQKFGRLMVLEFFGFAPNRHPTWKCLCECGTEKNISSYHLLRGETNSCGCLHREITTKHGYGRHGSNRSLLYHVWVSMKGRCLNPKDKSFKNYGGRGITVCKRWMSFENFLKDMGEKLPNLTIERKDNDGNYEPKNCRWATRAEQNRNKRKANKERSIENGGTK